MAKEAVEALVSALQGLANVLIWGGIFCLPLALLVGLPLFFLGRFFYRRRRQTRYAAGQAEVEAPAGDVAEDPPAENDISN